MTLSGFRLICLLPLLASVLPASESRSAPIESLQSADKIQEVLCAKQVGDHLAQQSVPDGVERVVNQVKALLPEIGDKSELIGQLLRLSMDFENTADGDYEALEHPEACEEVEVIFEDTAKAVSCFEEFTDYPSIVRENRAASPVLEAVFACRFNRFQAISEVIIHSDREGAKKLAEQIAARENRENKKDSLLPDVNVDSA